MSLATENTKLLSNGYFKYTQQQNAFSHCIDVLEKPLYNDYASTHSEDDFSASLTLQELLPFVDDPWWQRLRRMLFCTFWLAFWLILISACTLAYIKSAKQCSTTRGNAVTPITTTTITATAAGLLQAS